MSIIANVSLSMRASRYRLPHDPKTVTVFAAAVALMVGAWLLLAFLYSGIGGGQNVAEARGVISAVTSTRATSGSLDVQAILATSEYFNVTDRSDEIFKLDPEQGFVTLATTPQAFDVFDQSAESLKLDPDSTLPVLLVIDVQDRELQDQLDKRRPVGPRQRVTAERQLLSSGRCPGVFMVAASEDGR